MLLFRTKGFAHRVCVLENIYATRCGVLQCANELSVYD